jgi:hypothetical protein
MFLVISTGAAPMPVVAPRPPQPGIPAALGPRPGGGPTMSPISAGGGASDQEKVNNYRQIYLSIFYVTKPGGMALMCWTCIC